MVSQPSEHKTHNISEAIPTAITMLTFSHIKETSLGHSFRLSRSDLLFLPHPFVLYVPWTGGTPLSLALGQLWLNLDLFLLLYWPFPLESPSTFRLCFFHILQYFKVFIST